jgi:uncharacterized protein YndB with AHSA1/START domain
MTDTQVTAGDRELTITRTFDAPRELVFSAWTKPEHLTRWFGPNNFTVTVPEMDFRAGGKFRFCMRGPDIEHWVSGVYREIVPPQRIVWAGTMEHDHNEITTTVTFADLGGKTRVIVHQSYSIDSESSRGAQQGWTETLERLAAHLAAV